MPYLRVTFVTPGPATNERVCGLWFHAGPKRQQGLTPNRLGHDPSVTISPTRCSRNHPKVCAMSATIGSPSSPKHSDISNVARVEVKSNK